MLVFDILFEMNVSLFTREWIEIVIWTHKTWNSAESPSLRGSGLKYIERIRGILDEMSPSLRGSGLKYYSKIVVSNQ